MKCALFGCGALAAFSLVAVEVPENLTCLRPPRKVSWRMDRTEGDHIGWNSVNVQLSEYAPKRTVPLASDFFPAYCASRRARLTMSYKSDAPTAYVFESANQMERSLVSKDPSSIWRQKNFGKTAGEFKSFSWDIELPKGILDGAQISIVIEGKSGSFEAKDIRIVELPPAPSATKPVQVDGRRVTDIAILDAQDSLRRRDELRAARMLRYMLFENGFDYLPVRTFTDVKDIPASAVLVGRAAEVAGLFTADELKQTQGLTGAALYRVRSSRLGISGAIPAGIAYGVYSCLSDLGIEYLGGTQWRRPQSAALEIADGFGAVRVPAIPFRLDQSRIGSMVEMRGRYSFNRIFANMSAGLKKGNISVDHSMPAAIITTAEFGDSHPEFFALQKDGTRHGNETRAGVLQYCLTNPELQRITGERFVELMRADPDALCYMLAPGDGIGQTCCCEKCKALGSTSDALVTFANAVLARTKKDFPDKYIAIYSYVDTQRAPISGVKADPNLLVTYCIYPTSTWPSQMLWDTPINDEGRKAMSGWRQQCPRMGLVLYPMQCGDWMCLWPGFDFDVTAIRDYAEHRALLSRYFGFWPVHRIGISQAGAFADLRLNVLGKLEADPRYDVRAGVEAFMRDFYGAASGEMLKYFDLIQSEPKRLNWIQGCEEHRRGFVTKPFAAKGLAFLDAAEAAVANDPARLVAVHHEKILFLWSYLTDICRGRGNVSSAEFPEWAKRYGEFCRICRDTGVYYMGLCVKTWFNDTAFLDLKFKVDENWTKNALVKEIIADPAKALGVDFPNYQRVTSAGIEIPAQGMGGGSPNRASNYYRKDKADLRILRRATSGFGLVFTRVKLTDSPSRPVTLLITGIDNEKAAKAEMELVINDKSVFRGQVPWKKNRWSAEPFEIPAGLLKSGNNDIVIRNVTPDTEKDGACGDQFLAKRNYFWGWFMIEKLHFDGVK